MTPPSELAEAERHRHAAIVQVRSNESRTADDNAEAARESFYQAITEAHGDPADGLLTYNEIADASGWSRGWVRLAIENYKKRRKANTTT